MKAIFAAFGSYGDVKPFLWMAKELMRGGHEATLIANPHFRGAVEAEGIPFHPAGTEEDYRLAATPAVSAGDRFQDQREQITASRRLFTRMFLNPSRETYDIVSERRGGGTIVVGHFYAYGARLASERHALPYVNVCLSPYWLRGFVRPKGFGARLQRMKASSTTRFIDGQLFTKPFNALRAEAGLGPMTMSSTRWMFSANNLCLMPQWFPDFPLEEGLRAAFPGFPQGGEPGELPPRVSEFLSRCPAPVVFTPGSAVTDASAFFTAALPALERLGVPGIFLTKASASVPAALPNSVLHADYVPLGLLLGRCRAIVHHGGIGTAARALEAGTPQLLCPRIGEQEENARAIGRLGVSDTLPFAGLTADVLAGRLSRLIGDEKVRAACNDTAGRDMNIPEGWLESYIDGILRTNRK